MNACVYRLHRSSRHIARQQLLHLVFQGLPRRDFHRATAHGHDVIDGEPATAINPSLSSLNALYPRVESLDLKVSCRDFVRQYKQWGTEQTDDALSSRVVTGRISAKRSSGKKLFFVDIVEDKVKVQGIADLGKLENVTDLENFRKAFSKLSVGDNIRMVGYFRTSKHGQPSLQLARLPEVLSPCLHTVPEGLTNQETMVGNRHVLYHVSDRAASLIRAKSIITQTLRQSLLDDDFLEVQTPILADFAGGAIARPFRTHATEFVDRELALRIAPELWLKRLVVGGFGRVFEIGCSFRNEGIDHTHNPEFTTCEFYRSYTNLDGLMSITEQIFHRISKALVGAALPGLSSVPNISFAPSYKRVDFITGIEEALKADLPDLSSLGAFEEVKQLLADLMVPIDLDALSLPQLLDRLCGHFLEPLCHEPTYIINHPECMSPLAKSFRHPTRRNQKVAARAELFVQGQELANMYEEENSPVEQRRKFQKQLSLKGSEAANIDESYLEVLEWGLPPTGGWGCGIERLTMAMTGTKRISDVLSFGNLRHVVGRHQRLKASLSSRFAEKNAIASTMES